MARGAGQVQEPAYTPHSPYFSTITKLGDGLLNLSNENPHVYRQAFGIIRFSIAHSRGILIALNYLGSMSILLKPVPTGERAGQMERKPQILLVDDSNEIVEALKSFLGQKYIVLTASNGLDALRVFERNKKGVDLVITDMVMPDLSGAALISMIRAKSADILIIAMTGWGNYPSQLATEAQANMVLLKPFDLADLDQAVSSFLSEESKEKRSGMPTPLNTGSTPLMPKIAFC